MSRSPETSALICALLAVLLWSTVATAFKISLSYLSVMQLVAGASVVSTLVLASLLACQKRLAQAVISLRKHWRQAVLLGAINPLIYYPVLFAAYDRLPAQVAQPVNYTWAIALSLLSIPVLGQKPSLRDFAGMAAAYGGVVLVCVSGNRVTGSLDALGLSLALVSTFLWAGYWLLNTRDQRDPLTGLFQNFLVSLPILLVWVLWQEGLPSTADLRPWLGVLYVGLFEMGITFVLWQQALHRTQHVARISTLIFLSPFISLLLIHIFLGEPLYGLTFAGLGLIVAGLIVQHRGTKSESH